MFTIEQIAAAHSQVKSGADFPAYVQAIKELGVKSYTTYVHDGHTVYAGVSDNHIATAAKYDDLEIATNVLQEQFIKDLKTHQQGGSDYGTFCRQAAAAGVAKWTTDTDDMTCSYYGVVGDVVLAEMIPEVG